MVRKSRFWSLLCILVLIATLVPAVPVASAPAAPPDPLAELTSDTGGALRVAYHPVTGKVNFLATAPGKPWQAAGLAAQATTAARAETAARDFFSQYGPLFGLDAQSSLSIMRNVQRADGRTFVRLQQQYQGVPIFGGELIVQLDPAQAVEAVIGEAQPDLTLDTTPAISAADAVQAALDATAEAQGVAASTLHAGPAALWIYSPGLTEPQPGPKRLVWRVEVTPNALGPIRELVLVDAQRGSVALAFNQTDTALIRNTYTTSNTTLLPGLLVCNTGNPACTGGDAHAVGAHTNAGGTYNFYFNYLGRDSIDGAGMALVSTVHFDINYLNAFWDGTQMVYGDAANFPMADDVVAHELTHGVTQYESNLFYYYQSGAINEALSDVFGEFMDQTNGAGSDGAGVRWLLGEDATPLGAIRNMANPPAFGDPDKMTGANYRTASGDYSASGFDNGGVHHNSGLLNKLAYLLTDGATFNNITVSSIGLTKTAHIIYYAATNLLTSGSDYGDLYNALQMACSNLIGQFGIGSGDCQEVLDAANATEMNQQPLPGFNTEAPLCPGLETVVTNLFNDSLEPNANNWSFSALTGSNRWSRDDLYAHTGAYSLIADDFPALTSDSVAAMSSSIVLPAGAYLHFDHAFGFNGSGPDGGVVEYSTDGGSSWLDAAGLFQANPYNGTINAGPLATRQGFIGDSHGYISSRLLLWGLAGQSVRFRFRMSLNNGGADVGWAVDDVRIYTCSGSSSSSIPVFLPAIYRNFSYGPQTIMREGFEGNWPSAGWTRTDPGYEEYYWGKRSCRAATGSYSAWAMGAGSIGAGLGCGSDYINGAYSWMIYGPFSLEDANEAQLSVRLWLYTEFDKDDVCLAASTNGTYYTGTCYTGSTGGVFDPSPFVFDLTDVPDQGSLVGKANVWVALVFRSNSTNHLAEGAYADDLLLTRCQSGCPALSAEDQGHAHVTSYSIALDAPAALRPSERPRP